MEVSTVNTLVKNNLPRTISTIYLRSSTIMQGGHKVLDIGFWKNIYRPKFTVCNMMVAIIMVVEARAARDGMKTLKFFNQKFK